MNWRNIRLIYMREIRDQLRDRRTLFMIAVLPLLLYPLLGMSVFQLSQFLRTHVPHVILVGNEQLSSEAELPKLTAKGRFAAELFSDPADAERIEVIYSDSLDAAREQLQRGEVDVVVHIPPDFGRRIAELRAAVRAGTESAVDAAAKDRPRPPTVQEVPAPELLFNSAREESRNANGAVEQLLNTWKSLIVRENLLSTRVPATLARPFTLRPQDIAPPSQQQGRVWAKILPFVLFIWALTGAFYPAVDLCAGEKERGTLETLLSSPALRGEIVWGKLLTVMTFSAATAVLNLVSLGFTARFVTSQLQSVFADDLTIGFDLPPLSAALWLLVALVPISALFSALCLASAAFARSSKEGQYYLMPLLMILMPLMMLPMAPGAELSLGNSLIPVTGVVLLLKSLVQGNYGEALRYFIPVCLMTAVCCRLAIRWAIYQFNQESIIFRESERFDLRRWVVHLVRDRQATPSLGEAFAGVAVIYVIQFFIRLAMSAHMPAAPDFNYFVLVIFISIVVCIATPALLMTVMLTSRPLKTLSLDCVPAISGCLMAVLLAVSLHPAGQQLSLWIRQLYPVQADALAGFEGVFAGETSLWRILLLMAVLPAICEELAFRGFILSGLRHFGQKWWAIGMSAVFFGFAHSLVQQSLAATLLGVVLGYIAIQTGSLIPCILFHMTHNALMIATSKWPELVEQWPALRYFVHEASPDQALYPWYVVASSALAATALLIWFYHLPYRATQEERLTDARAQQTHLPMANGAASTAE